MFKFILGILLAAVAYSVIEVSYDGANNNDFLTLAGIFLVAYSGHLVIKS